MTANAHQEAKLEKLRGLARESDLDFDDATLLRVLDFRNWNVDRTLWSLKERARFTKQLNPRQWLDTKPPNFDSTVGMLSRSRSKDPKFEFDWCAGFAKPNGEGDGLPFFYTRPGLAASLPFYKLLSAEEAARAGQFLVENALRSMRECGANQVIFIEDHRQHPSGAKWSVILHNLRLFKIWIAQCDVLYSDQVAKLFLINLPWFWTALWRLVRPFVSKAIQRRLVFVSTDPKAELLKHFDARVLPNEWGGTAGKLDDLSTPTFADKDINWSQSKTLDTKDDVETTDLRPGEKHCKAFAETRHDQALWWWFSTKTKQPISFCARFAPLDGSPETDLYQKTDIQSASDTVHPETFGTLYLEWHNTSWFTTKTILFMTRTIDQE